jgi:hypothetical protein
MIGHMIIPPNCYSVDRCTISVCVSLRIKCNPRLITPWFYEPEAGPLFSCWFDPIEVTRPHRGPASVFAVTRTMFSVDAIGPDVPVGISPPRSAAFRLGREDERPVCRRTAVASASAARQTALPSYLYSGLSREVGRVISGVPGVEFDLPSERWTLLAMCCNTGSQIGRRSKA